MYKDLKGKVAVVTGGSKGIGEAIALRLAEEKMAVVINYHSDEKRANDSVKAIKEKGGKAVAVQADIGSEEGATTLLNAAVENLVLYIYGLTMLVWRIKLPHMNYPLMTGRKS